ncbi:MAG TPA: LacI family DNA-binding transcriptional regulator [Capsulimonadaceae bacterium]|jgi:LacI family transcriptional regulator
MNTRARKPSSIDVAKIASVSQATVSYVLNGKSEGLVSEETRLRVLDAARQVGYRPNNLATALLKGRTNTVGVFTSYLGSRFHADIVLGAQQVLEEHGYSLLLTASELDHMARASRIEFMMNHRVDALMVIGGFYTSATPPDWLDTVLVEKTPCVVVDDASCAQHVDCVVSDDVDGVRQAVAHLAQLGHKRVAYHPGFWNSTTAHERRDGFLQSVAEFGLDPRPEYCPPIPPSRDAEFANIEALITMAVPPTAIITANDHMAGDVIREARRLGRSVPDDIGLVGYANQEISWVMEFSSIDQKPRHMGKVAALRLIDRLSNADSPVEMIRTPVELIARESTLGYTRGIG